MWYYVTKIAISAITIVVISEAAKRSSLVGALVASLPLTSLLAIIWMHVEKSDSRQIGELSRSIFWLVLPSLAFFLIFPALLEKGWTFWSSMGVSVSITIGLYVLLLWGGRYLHIPIG